jgi:hypothetical protein
MNAFTVGLYGLAVLVFVAGLVDAYSWKLGLVGGIALSVLGITLRVYVFATDEDEEFGNYEPRELWAYSDTAGRQTRKAQTPEVQVQMETRSRYVWDATKLAWVKETEDEI